jgi:hypothetical protein
VKGIGVCALLLAASAPAGHKAPWFTSQECRVSFQYPRGWRVTTHSEPPCSFVVSSMRRDEHDEVSIRVGLGDIDDELTDVADIERQEQITGAGWRGVIGWVSARCNPPNVPGSARCDLPTAVIGTRERWAEIQGDGSTGIEDFEIIVRLFSFEIRKE